VNKRAETSTFVFIALILGSLWLGQLYFQEAAKSVTGVGTVCGDSVCHASELYSCPSDCNSHPPPGGGSSPPPPPGSSPPPPPVSPPDEEDSFWTAEYFPNEFLSGSPAFTEKISSVSFDWAQASPASGIPSDGFSARFSKTVYFTNGTYSFAVTADDGVRVRVNNEVIIDEWRTQSATTFTTTHYLPSGLHRLEVDYYDSNYDAVLSFSYSNATSQQSTSDWTVDDFFVLGPVKSVMDVAVTDANFAPDNDNDAWGVCGAPIQWIQTDGFATAKFTPPSFSADPCHIGIGYEDISQGEVWKVEFEVRVDGWRGYKLSNAGGGVGIDYRKSTNFGAGRDGTLNGVAYGTKESDGGKWVKVVQYFKVPSGVVSEIEAPAIISGGYAAYQIEGLPPNFGSGTSRGGMNFRYFITEVKHRGTLWFHVPWFDSWESGMLRNVRVTRHSSGSLGGGMITSGEVLLKPVFSASTMTHYGSGGVTYSGGVASLFGEINQDPSHIVYGYGDGKPGDVVTFEFETKAGPDVHTTWDNGCGGGWDIDFGASDGYVIRNTFNGAATRSKDWTHVKYEVVIPAKDTVPRLDGQTLVSSGQASWTFTNLVTGTVQTNSGSGTSSGGVNMGGRGGLTFPSSIRYRFWWHYWFGSQTECLMRNASIRIRHQ